MRARSDAFGAAASAARVGAQQLVEEDLVLGRARIDQFAAEAAVAEVLGARGYDATVEVTDTEVRVTVEGTTQFAILPGSSSYRVTAAAEVVQGTGHL